MNNTVLNKPNQLICLVPEQKISLTEKKAYNYMLLYAQEKLKFKDFDGNTFKIPRYILHEKANLKNDNNSYIYKRLEKLMQTVVRIFREKDNKKEWKKSFTLLSSIEKTDDDCYEFELNKHIIDGLKNLRFFTPLDLIFVNCLDSQYSIIFYELAIKYKKYKIPKMSIEEVRKLTHTEDQYKRFYDFRRYVLDTACEEISEKTDIRLSYTTEKRGRRIAYIDFEIEEKTKKEKEMRKLLARGEMLLEEADKLLEEDEARNSPESSQKAQNELDNKIDELYIMLPEKEQIDSNRKVLKELLKKYEYKYIKADINHAKKFADKNFIGFLKASCEAGHWGKVELEKKEKRKELVKKKREEEKKKKEEEREKQKEMEEIVATKCENLTGAEREKLRKRYNYLRKVDSKNISFEDRAIKLFAENHDFDEFLKKHFKSKIEN